MVNQIELHPGFLQADSRAACAEHDILVEAYSPLGTGKVLGDPVLEAIAEAHGKTPAHVAIRWCLQHGTLPLPKSVTPERIVANGDIFDFELSVDEMAAIDVIDTGRLNGDPDAVPF